jgi:hypothetical protein
MAFKDYLTPNSYTSVSNMIYEKGLKRCTVMLEVWSDESKSVLLANKGVTVDGSVKIPSLASLKNKLKAVPTEIVPQMGYIIDVNAEEELAGYEGQLTRYNPVTKNWDKWVLWDGLIMFAEDEEKYYLFKDGVWSELKDFSADLRIWNEWLAPEIAMVDGKNPMQQMYKFMKTLPQFKDCEDV